MLSEKSVSISVFEGVALRTSMVPGTEYAARFLLTALPLTFLKLLPWQKTIPKSFFKSLLTYVPLVSFIHFSFNSRLTTMQS